MADGNDRLPPHTLRIFSGHLLAAEQFTVISVAETATTQQVLKLTLRKLDIKDKADNFELVEVCYRDSVFDHESERILTSVEHPVLVQQGWTSLPPKARTSYRLFIREKLRGSGDKKREPLRHHWMDSHEYVRNCRELDFDLESRLTNDDLCRLPTLSEQNLLEHLEQRFSRGRIYTYVGEILIAVNPFRFFPMYNPKFINAYNNRNLGSLPPHIFAIADVAFHRMLRERKSQCVVISGESGSGKTESTKLIVHHLTALGLKTRESSVEKTILGVGPVLEAFGNARTAYNNNSSRFGKFTQIKFREDGAVCGAALRKYLLEKSRIVSQAPDERNYHVFYYLLAGASVEDREELHLSKPEKYSYLNQNECYTLEEIDEVYEFLRLKKSMDMVGFTADVQKRIFGILSAVLHIGNLEFLQKPGHEDATIKDSEDLTIVSNLLMVACNKLVEVLTTKKTKTRDEQFIVPYKYEEAVATRDAMAKALYGTLFDWIVLQVNHALAVKQSTIKEGCSIGVLDIFGFEDYEHNSFEQFCINLANEKLQFYFNQHVFKLEQDEYVSEGIDWRNVDFVDNTGCLDLICGRPTGLLNLIDEESSFPGASESSLLAKLNKNHSGHKYYEQSLIQQAFVIKHYAGSVKYNIKGFLDKNRDLMRPDILSVLKNSDSRFVRDLLGADPVAVYRWSILRSFFKAVYAFKIAGKQCRSSGRAIERHGGKKKRSLVKDPRTNLFDPEERPAVSNHETASLFRKASRVVRRMQSIKQTTKPLSKIRQGLETKRDMSVRTYDFLFKGTMQRSKGTPKNPPTVSAQFQSSLNRLVEILEESQPFFVRCIRSNAEKKIMRHPSVQVCHHMHIDAVSVDLATKDNCPIGRQSCLEKRTEAPLTFDRDLVVRQLRYTGMLETIRIRTLGYQWRFTLDEFIKRYSLLFPRRRVENVREEMPSILQSLGLDPREYQIGKQKVFLRDSQHSLLQVRLHSEQIHLVCILQRWIKGLLQRRQFLRQRNAAVVIQAAWRGFVVRAENAERTAAAIRIQSSWRTFAARRTYQQVRDSVVLIQSHVRGYLARRHVESVDLHRRLMSESQVPSEAISPCKHEHLRPISRSLSDPSYYEDVRLEASRKPQVVQSPDPETTSTETDSIEHEESPASPRERTHSKVKNISKLFEDKLALDEPRRQLVQQRSISEPNSPQSKKRQRPTPLTLTPSQDSAKRTFQRLSPIPSPTTPDSEADNLPVELKSPTALSRKVTSSIRRRLSSKAKQGQRFSTSDVLSDSRPRSPPSVKDDLAVMRPGVESDFSDTLKRTVGENRKVKRGFFHKMAHSNSFRRRSDSNLNKNSVKKVSEPVRVTGSQEDLAKALRQTKIVSCTLTPGPVQWKNTGHKFVRGTEELGELEMFLMNKVSILNKEENKRDTIVDRVFRKALQEFHLQLISTYSVLLKNDQTMTLKYEELMGHFEFTLKKVIKSERITASFPIIMGVNAFGGVLSEFIATRSREVSKPSKHHKKPHSKKRKASELTEFHGHKFAATQFSISTFCEHCGGYIWTLDKGFVCQECKFTCHKKCYSKSQNICRKGDNSSKGKTELFGGDLSDLVSNQQSIPPLVDKLLQDIENRGLYSEGLYRKSPSAAAVKKLKNTIVSSGFDNLNFEDYSVHVVAGVLKLFFRQLAAPVVTVDFYMDFMRTAELKEDGLRRQTLCSLVRKLPRASKNTVERLVFHLARISQHQDQNLMSPNALSIIWAPCVMSAPPGTSALEGLKDIAKQTLCLETLILGQMSNIRTTLSNIRVLDKASDTAYKRLSMLNFNEDEGLVETELEGEEDEKRLLTEQILELEEQRSLLTAKLTSLEPGVPKGLESGEDMTSDEYQTDDDLDGADDDRVEECAVSFDLPATPIQLRHLTKNRARQPIKRRRPTRTRLREQALQR